MSKCKKCGKELKCTNVILSVDSSLLSKKDFYSGGGGGYCSNRRTIGTK